MLREEAPHVSRQLEGEKRVATVIMADVQGSTDLLEKIGTEDWVDMMNNIFQVLENEIYSFGGTIDQYRGDGLVAFFGAREAHEDDPERAVLAALTMQEAFRKLAEQYFKDNDGEELHLRVGVNTGEVISTSIGNSDRHQEETAMGEAISIASRMETSAEPDTVLVSENTYRLVQTKFQWEDLGEIQIKGVSQPIAVYRPLNLVESNDWVNRSLQYERIPPLIGRKNEIEELKNAVNDLYLGRGGISFVTGEQGMGKTFLVAHLRQQFERREILLKQITQKVTEGALSPEEAQEVLANEGVSLEMVPEKMIWLGGRCRSYRQAWPFSVWRDILQAWLNIRDNESEEEILARLRNQSHELWGDRMERYYPYLATFLWLPLEEEFKEQVKYLDAEALQHQFFRAIWNWVSAMANRGPLVLAFADVQWINDTSLELLRYCLPLCDDSKLLLLIIYRPDRSSPAWSFQHYVETEFPHRVITVNLPAMTVEECNEYIDHLVGPDALDPQAKHVVIYKAEGNPFYIKELLDGLIARKALEKDPETGKWKATRRITSLDVPDSLQGLLLARVDRLTATERHVLQMASVVGTVFWERMILAISDGEEGVPRALTQLQRHQLISERSRDTNMGVEFSFDSPLMREVVYESLLRTQRMDYHLKVAKFLESSIEADDLPQNYGFMAYHYQQAGNPAKELFYISKAAQTARDIYANKEALGYYQRAAIILKDLEKDAHKKPRRLKAIREQEFENLLEMTEVFDRMGAFEHAAENGEKLLALSNKLEDSPTFRIDALLIQPQVIRADNFEELEEGIRMAEEALALSRGIGDRHRELLALMKLWNLRDQAGDPGLLDFGEQVLNFAREIGDKETEVRILLGISNTYGVDQQEKMAKYMDSTTRIIDEIDNPELEIHLLALMCSKFEMDGDYYKTLSEYANKMLKIARETGMRSQEGWALEICGQMRALYLGDHAGGLPLLKEAFRILPQRSSARFPALRLAHSYIMQNEFGKAKEMLDFAQNNQVVLSQIGRVGGNLGWVNYWIAQSVDKASLIEGMRLMDEVRTLSEEEKTISKQYSMAATCKQAQCQMKLADQEPNEAGKYLQAALTLAENSFHVYLDFGFIQVVECPSEEVIYTYGLSLERNGQEDNARNILQKSYDEMMRKYALIPEESEYRETFLVNIPLHKQILEKHNSLSSH